MIIIKVASIIDHLQIPYTLNLKSLKNPKTSHPLKPYLTSSLISLQKSNKIIQTLIQPDPKSTFQNLQI